MTELSAVQGNISKFKDCLGKISFFLGEGGQLTLYKAASDPTYLKRGGAESARTSVLGPRCPERPNDDSLLNF